MPAHIARSIHGAFGEILQGYTIGPSGFEHFLFTAPVEELRCQARLKREGIPSTAALTVSPADRVKALRAYDMLSADLQRPTRGAAIEIRSNIPVAKGYASSTADILAAALLCVAEAFPGTAEPVAHALALSVARRLEYGDYLLHPGISSCHQRSQTLIAKYHTDLRWTIVGVDEGGYVRTEEFHREVPEDPGKASVYEQLFRELDAALLANDGEAAARIATRSAELHNDRLPKKSLDDLRALQKNFGALGICVAHSGTLAGLIFSRHQPEHDARVRECRDALDSLGHTSSTFTLKEAKRP
ncbi:GHMP family kinase ATP-binding protein [Streptomyces sp. URMC 123]|uniref:GHMP family kinase ATP-binding protein n=1 Tax=Streptomyces sp. URMC 123 TaxID=3423403 RepID=UPI003F1CB5D2